MTVLRVHIGRIFISDQETLFEKEDQTLPLGAPTMEKQQKRINAQGDIKTLLRRDCEEQKVMRFFREMEIFQEISM